jgi:hypothetical protein
MKKFTLISIILVIFAGFSPSPFKNVFAQTLPIGTSEKSCRKMSVKLEIKEEKRIWRECTDSNEIGCQLRFCNELPKNDGTNWWKKSECNKYCVGFQELIPIGGKNIKSISGESGTDLMMNYVSMIYKFGAIILGLIAVLVIVASGVQMIAGGVDESNYTDAKDRILQAILSLIMLFSSALILRTVNPDFFNTGNSPSAFIQMQKNVDISKKIG